MVLSIPWKVEAVRDEMGRGLAGDHQHEQRQNFQTAKIGVCLCVVLYVALMEMRSRHGDHFAIAKYHE